MRFFAGMLAVLGSLLTVPATAQIIDPNVAGRATPPLTTPLVPTGDESAETVEASPSRRKYASGSSWNTRAP